MKTRYLLPNRFKKIGWMLFIPAAITGLLMVLFGFYLFSIDGTVFAIYDGGIMEPSKVFSFTENEIADEIVAVLAIVGGLLAAFSEEKEEDEYIAKIRLESLLWATYINYGFLLLSILFIYGMGFYQVMLFNIFTLLIIFLIRFNYIFHKTSRAFA